jgi:outer membrane protein assembly factor BamB
MPNRATFVLLGALVCGLARPGLAIEPGATVESALRTIGVRRGICAVLDDRGCRLARALASSSELIVYVQLSRGEDVAAARRAADRAGLYGTRIFVDQGTGQRIGLADDLADAVIVPAGPSAVSRAEILRVLRPEGRAILGGELVVKPFPEGTDDWTHHYHRPDNNAQSQDRLARAPYLTQFVAEPRYAPAPQAAVASAGRLFMAFGHIAWHQREESVLNTLVAVNGFNGTLLWKRPLVTGIMVDRSTMIATPQTLYLADDRSCKLLDAASGQLRDEIVAPRDLTGGTFWKWMALEQGVLYALVGAAEPKDPNALWKSVRHGWPWDGISKGYNDPTYAWGFAHTLLAIDPATKKVLWSHREDAPIDSRALCLRGGRLYYCNFGRYVACLDAATGSALWRRTAEKDADVFESLGPYRPGHGYIGGWKSTVYLRCTDKALYFVGPQVERLTALSAEDGHVLFTHYAKDLQIILRQDGLYTIGAQNRTDDTRKLDPLTGKTLVQYHTWRRACTRATGTCDSILFRGHEGSGRLDLSAGQTAWISATRPSCHVGVIVAAGHLYWLPWACDCNLQLFGVLACGPAGDFPFAEAADPKERLQVEGSGLGVQGSGGVVQGSGARVEPRSPTSEAQALSPDWRTYRHDSARTGRTSAAIPGQPRLIWQLPAQPDAEPSAPVCAGGLVFIGRSNGSVQALEAANGQIRWRAYTGGGVRYPPTIAGDLALAGSDDGWAYAFRAATGAPVWRFRAAPIERKIRMYDKLVSTWPVAGGVLEEAGRAYFAAGINDFDGTHLYCLEADSGKIVWQNHTAGHLDRFSRRGVACQGDLLLHDGKLYLAGGNSVSPGVFDAANGECLNSPPGGMGTSAPRGRELHLVGNQVRVSGQPLYSLAVYPVYDPSTAWARAVIAAANGKLELTAGRDGKGPWSLVARTPDESRELWSYPLPAAPVRYALAVDSDGRIVVALADGRLLCLGR